MTSTKLTFLCLLRAPNKSLKPKAKWLAVAEHLHPLFQRQITEPTIVTSARPKLRNQLANGWLKVEKGLVAAVLNGCWNTWKVETIHPLEKTKETPCCQPHPKRHLKKDADFNSQGAGGVQTMIAKRAEEIPRIRKVSMAKSSGFNHAIRVPASLQIARPCQGRS